MIFSEYGICLFSYLTFIKAIVIKNLVHTMSQYIKWLFYKDHVDSFFEVRLLDMNDLSSMGYL